MRTPNIESLLSKHVTTIIREYVALEKKLARLRRGSFNSKEARAVERAIYKLDSEITRISKITDRFDTLNFIGPIT